MKLDIFDKNGKALEQIDLEESVFGVVPNDTVLSQYIRVFTNNQRQGTSSTKTRSEVSGGGKKPWKQKGTGRARVGSTRNPLWRHGGISHGPQPHSWSRVLTKALRRLALVSALSIKINRENISIIDSLHMTKPNTKGLEKVLDAIKATSRKTLIILDSNDMVLRKSADNLPNVATALVENVNAYEVLKATKVVFLKKSVEKLQEKYKLASTKAEKTEKKVEKVKKKVKSNETK